MKTFLLIVLLILLILAIGFVAYGRENTWKFIAGDPDTGPMDIKTLTRTGKPNDGLICSEGFCPNGLTADITAPLFDAKPSDIIGQIETNMRESGLRYERVDDRSDVNRIRFLTWSETMRFPDLTEFILLETGQGQTALIGYAKAHVGYSDMGSNLNRLKMLTSGL